VRQLRHALVTLAGILCLLGVTIDVLRNWDRNGLIAAPRDPANGYRRYGVREIRRLLGGAAYIEAYAREDDMEGDMDGWHFRPASVLRREFRQAGLTHCGLYCFIDARKITAVNALEVCP